VLHEGPEALDALVEAGELLAAQGERQAARARWREALERGPDTPQAGRARALLAADEGRTPSGGDGR
jgi:TolA-binding protein